jgi:hypothetical protein
VAAVEEGVVRVRIAQIDTHLVVPVVGDRRKHRIKRGAQCGDQRRKRVREVFVLPLAEAVPGHDDAAAKAAIVGVESGDPDTFLGPQQLRQNGGAALCELTGGIVPVDTRDTVGGRSGSGLHMPDSGCTGHVVFSRSSKARLRSTPQR